VSVLLDALESRAPELRELRKLSARPGTVKGKRVKGTKKWYELTFGSGSRLYYVPGERTTVLLSSKKRQLSEDVPYLKEFVPGA